MVSERHTELYPVSALDAKVIWHPLGTYDLRAPSREASASQIWHILTGWCLSNDSNSRGAAPGQYVHEAQTTASSNKVKIIA